MLTLMLLRRLSAPAAAFCLSLLFSGQVHAQSWQKVEPAGAGFSVYLPGPAEESENPVNTVAGPVTMHLYSATIGTQAYMTSYADSPVPLDAERALAGARDNAVGRGHLISETRITTNGVRGISFSAARDGLHFVAEVWVSGNRIFQALYLTQEEGPLPVTAQRFFNSFHFVR